MAQGPSSARAETFFSRINLLCYYKVKETSMNTEDTIWNLYGIVFNHCYTIFILSSDTCTILFPFYYNLLKLCPLQSPPSDRSCFILTLIRNNTNRRKPKDPKTCTLVLTSLSNSSLFVWLRDYIERK